MLTASLGSVPRSFAADIASVWDGSVGSWTDAHWSASTFPNNTAADSYLAEINSGRVTLNQNITIKRLTLGGGVFDSAAGGFSLSAVEGFQWTGGQITGTGNLNISANSTITGGVIPLVLSGRTLVNSGAVLFDQGVLRGGSNAVINNARGASFTVLNDTSLYADVASPAYTFNNAGTFTTRATSGIGFATVDAIFNNTGTVNVERLGGTGQTLSLAGGGTQGGVFNLQDGTKVEFGNGSTLVTGLTITGNGTAVIAGQVVMSGNIQARNVAVAVGDLNVGPHFFQILGAASQQGGTIRLNGGNLSVANEAGLAMDDGLITGVGTLDGALNAFGNIAPGNPLGTLTITRNAVFNDDAQLSIEIGGTGAGQADRLTLFGRGTLGGKLSISLLNGLIPSPGDSFTILTAGQGVSGFFLNAPVDGGRILTADGLNSFVIDYTANSVVLTGFVPEPGMLPLLTAMALVVLMKRPQRKRSAHW
ncbi:hypothetical protein ACXR0O_20855 [Verrucomicrobiota bacterium sgz303538]